MGQAGTVEGNPLWYEPIGKLLLRFAVPSIISFLVSALYNIVDQIFIGQGVGMLGNAATNVAFPLTTISTSIALLIGVGAASNFNLEQGRGNRERAGQIAGSGIAMLALSGIALAAAVLLFLNPLLLLFGATEEVLPYAQSYTGITAFGIPLLIFTTGGSHMIRADGSPRYAMYCMLSGALLNTVLDPLFIFRLDMGIAGAALATVLGQAVSAGMAISYFPRFRSVRITWRLLRPRGDCMRAIAALGAAACFNQLAMTLVQITMNNTLTFYGALSDYGQNIPLACVGVISKVNVVLMAFIIGTAQGCQPICGFNYGAKNYPRVKKTYLTAAAVVTAISTAAFLCFQIFPRQIVAIFGEGSLFPLCGTVFPHLYDAGVSQRHPAADRQLFHLDRQGKDGDFDVHDPPDPVPAPVDRDLPPLFRDRRGDVCRPDCRRGRRAALGLSGGPGTARYGKTQNRLSCGRRGARAFPVWKPLQNI